MAEELPQPLGQEEPPAPLTALRPLLRLALFADTLRGKCLRLAERSFWSELDELRVKIFQTHLRQKLTPAQHWRSRKIMWDFHVRAFGEKWRGSISYRKKGARRPWRK